VAIYPMGKVFTITTLLLQFILGVFRFIKYLISIYFDNSHTKKFNPWNLDFKLSSTTFNIYFTFIFRVFTHIIKSRMQNCRWIMRSIWLKKILIFKDKNFSRNTKFVRIRIITHKSFMKIAISNKSISNRLSSKLQASMDGKWKEKGKHRQVSASCLLHDHVMGQWTCLRMYITGHFVLKAVVLVFRIELNYR
jgi:hypothetical protein